MNPETWQRIKELFGKAIELPPKARERMLREIETESPEVAAELSRLLTNHEEAGDFIETPIVEGFKEDRGAPAHFEAGTEIGPFRIIETIGVGGMGTVYLAEQGSPVRRRVALKVIRASLISPKILARFDSERQALALMNHPNIAQIYHADTTAEGLPYFAMEYVPGEHLTSYCDQRNLNLDKRLELFIQACHAFEHAHARGIIHRDIKPSNILVTEQPEGPQIKIIDFGIVKATEHKLTDTTLTTHSGLILGTLAYLSPEQAGVTEDPVGPYSDIYALGLVLYELLTGEVPFGTGTDLPFHKTLTNIRDLQPKPPGSFYREGTPEARKAAGRRGSTTQALADRFAGGLDTVVNKAVAKRPGDRYNSIDNMVIDIQRCLDQKPLSTEIPEEAVSTANAYAGPSRLRTIAALICLPAALIGFIGWYSARQDIASLQQDFLIADRAGELYLQLLEQERRPMEYAAGKRDAIRRELLDMYREHLELPDNRAANLALARCFHQLGDYEKAVTLLSVDHLPVSAENALALGHAHAAAFSGRLRLARLKSEGEYLSAMGRLQRLHMEPARDNLQKARRARLFNGGYSAALLARLDGRDVEAIAVLEPLTGDASVAPSPFLLHGDILAEQGLKFHERARPDRAGELLAEAREAFTTALRAFPGNPKPALRLAWLNLAELHVTRTVISESENRLEEALDWCRTALTIAPHLAEGHLLSAAALEKQASAADEMKKRALLARAAEHRQKASRQ
ncbi:MAG: serine/threonine-protein kinase [Acidobacteriota bacterium]|nr:serine/threonine-protein kinase [Acidobacteriota bacterium]